MNKLPYVSIILMAIFANFTLLFADIILNFPVDKNPWVISINEVIIPIVFLGVIAMLAAMVNRKAQLGIQQPFITFFLSGLLFTKVSSLLAYAPLPLLFLGNVTITIIIIYTSVSILSYCKVVHYK